MFGLRYVVSCAVILTIALQLACALTDEEKAKMFGDLLPHITECSKEFSVTPEQIKADGKAGNLDGCLIKCILKRIKVMDDKGLLDVDKASELVQTKLSNEDDKKKVAEIISKCSSVNDQAVGDGDEGCERAKLLLECAKPFKNQFLMSA